LIWFFFDKASDGPLEEEVDMMAGCDGGKWMKF
jgi:hypothetical protein